MKKLLSLLLFFLLSLTILSAQHLKKDGTPDMRYKENKTTYSSTTYTAPASTTTTTTYNTTQHLKKDGTPDMRYKENKTSYTSTSTSVPKYSSNTNNSYSVRRDSNGKIIRSESAKYEFKKQTGYPHGRPGYVIDHIKPLKEGGCDCPENMQWQTTAEGKAKDKWE